MGTWCRPLSRNFKHLHPANPILRRTFCRPNIFPVDFLRDVIGGFSEVSKKKSRDLYCPKSNEPYKTLINDCNDFSVVKVVDVMEYTKNWCQIRVSFDSTLWPHQWQELFRSSTLFSMISQRSYTQTFANLTILIGVDRCMSVSFYSLQTIVSSTYLNLLAR